MEHLKNLIGKLRIQRSYAALMKELFSTCSCCNSLGLHCFPPYQSQRSKKFMFPHFAESNMSSLFSLYFPCSLCSFPKAMVDNENETTAWLTFIFARKSLIETCKRRKKIEASRTDLNVDKMIFKLVFTIDVRWNMPRNKSRRR